MKLWQLFEQRWRDKCTEPCILDSDTRFTCSCWQWAVTREEHSSNEWVGGKRAYPNLPEP